MNGSRILALVAVLCALATIALGLVYAGGHSPGALDASAAKAFEGIGHGTPNVLVLSTEPYVLIPAIAIIAGICLHLRRRTDALLAVAGPAVALALNTWVLKPLFDRWKNDILVYPSGHTVSLVTVLVVLVLLARPGARTALAVVIGVVLLCCAAIGMIGLGYHYLTDIAGGTFFATAVVTGLRAAFTPRRVPAPSAD